MIKLKSLLLEQSAVWQNVTPSGTGEDTEKRIITNILASNLLTDPQGNQIRLDTGPEGMPLYVGAGIQAVYREKVNLQTTKTQLTVNSGRFGCSIQIYVSTKQNAEPNYARTGRGGAENSGIDMINYKMIQQKNMKFQLVPFNNIANNNYLKDIGFFAKTKEGKLYSGLGILAIGGQISNNLSAYIGDAYSKINTELARLGFPDLPNAVNIITATMV
jgi:hypothetical protein